MPSSQSVRRILLALAGLIGMLGTDVAVAHAGYGELGSPTILTGKVSESKLLPHAFGVDPTDGSFYVGDEVTKIEGGKELHFYRIQKFSASAELLGEAQIKANPNSELLGNGALEGIAVDPSNKRVYVLTVVRREEEEGEPVFDSELPAAEDLYAFSTEVKNGEHKLEPAAGTEAEGVFAKLKGGTKTAQTALLEPHGLAVDPTNGDVVIVGQADLQKTAGEPTELRAAVQRIHADKTSGPRYIDLANCLDEGMGSGEPACEDEAGLGHDTQPFSPIVVPGAKGATEGKVYVERKGEIWEIPSSQTEIEPKSKRFETHPKRLLPTDSKDELGAEQKLIQFPKPGEEFAEEVGGTMSYAPAAAEGEGKIYLTTAVTTEVEKGKTVTNAGVLVLGYSEHGGAAEAKELGWTGGQAESSGESCSIPKKGNAGLLIGVDKEDVFVFDAHSKELGSGSPGVDIFGFGPGGSGCPQAAVTVPSVKVKNNQGTEVEVSPVPLGEPATLSSTVNGGNAVKVKWEFKDLSTGEGEPAEESPYEFETTSLQHKFEHTGTYRITEIVETDDLASPKLEVSREITVGATPIAVELSYPAVITTGQAASFEATVRDPHEPSTPHLKYVWQFGDGEEKSGETTSASFSVEHTYQTEGPKSATLKVTDGHGVSAETTSTISVGGPPKTGGGGGGGTGGGTGGGPPPPPGPTPESSPIATLASTSLNVNPIGAVSVSVTCPAGDSSCSGTVTLRTLGAVAARAAGRHKKGKHKVVLTLASGSFTVAGGKVQAVTLHLSAQARALLARSHILHAQATVVAHNAAGASHTTQATVTLRMATKSKRRHKH